MSTVRISPVGGTIGATGPTGASGTVGATGATGPAGATGSGGSSLVYVQKPSDTVRSSTTTSTADPHLVVALTTGTWIIEAHYRATAASVTPDIQISHVFSGTSTNAFQFRGFGGITSDASALRGVYTDVGVGLGTGVFSYFGLDGIINGSHLSMTIEMTVTGVGNLTTYWAQVASSTDTTTLMTGSFLLGTKVA